MGDTATQPTARKGKVWIIAGSLFLVGATIVSIPLFKTARAFNRAADATEQASDKVVGLVDDGKAAASAAKEKVGDWLQERKDRKAGEAALAAAEGTDPSETATNLTAAADEMIDQAKADAAHVKGWLQQKKEAAKKALEEAARKKDAEKPAQESAPVAKSDKPGSAPTPK